MMALHDGTERFLTQRKRSLETDHSQICACCASSYSNHDLTAHCNLYTYPTTPLLRCPRSETSVSQDPIREVHIHLFARININKTQFISFDIQITSRSQESNVPRLCKRGSVNRGPNTVNPRRIRVLVGQPPVL